MHAPWNATGEAKEQSVARASNACQRAASVLNGVSTKQASTEGGKKSNTELYIFQLDMAVLRTLGPITAEAMAAVRGEFVTHRDKNVYSNLAIAFALCNLCNGACESPNGDAAVVNRADISGWAAAVRSTSSLINDAAMPMHVLFDRSEPDCMTPQHDETMRVHVTRACQRETSFSILYSIEQSINEVDTLAILFPTKLPFPAPINNDLQPDSMWPCAKLDDQHPTFDSRSSRPFMSGFVPRVTYFRRLRAIHEEGHMQQLLLLMAHLEQPDTVEVRVQVFRFAPKEPSAQRTPAQSGQGGAPGADPAAGRP